VRLAPVLPLVALGVVVVLTLCLYRPEGPALTDDKPDFDALEGPPSVVVVQYEQPHQQ
jgi:hypothetical protein